MTASLTSKVGYVFKRAAQTFVAANLVVAAGQAYNASQDDLEGFVTERLAAVGVPVGNPVEETLLRATLPGALIGNKLGSHSPT